MSASFEMAGKIKEIFETQTFGSGFQKREFVVMEDDDGNNRYPNPVKMSFTKEHCAKLDSYAVGDDVKVSFSVQGREWNDPKTNQIRYFVDIHAFRIEKLNADGSSVEMEAPAPTDSMEPIDSISDSDDLPF